MIERISGWAASILPRHFALAAFCVLSVAYIASFRYDLYGIDEGAARALLMDWSLGSNVLNPVAVLGFPDMRALLFSPLDFHWIGDLTAARVLCMFLTLATGLMLYRWAEKQLGDETALFATGLWFIAPLTISQMGSLGAGNVLILACILCYWSVAYYRASEHAMPGNYFVLLLLIALATSMHPAGIGMAIALAWHETRVQRPAQGKRIALLVGLVLMLAFVLLSRMGWPSLNLFTNPLAALTSVLKGDVTELPSTGLALLVAGMLLLALAAGVRRMRTDLFSCMLSAGIIVGSICADMAWAELVLTYILFEGLRALVALNNRLGGHSLMRRRGVVIVCVLVLASGFSMLDKQRFLFKQAGGMHPVDALIEETGRLMQDLKGKAMVASQWPGRTMLATRRGVLPLPPLHPGDPDAFLRQMRGVSLMVYDHHAAAMKGLNQQVAALSNRVHTEAILPGGVILRLLSQ